MVPVPTVPVRWRDKKYSFGQGCVSDMPEIYEIPVALKIGFVNQAIIINCLFPFLERL